MLQYSDTLIMGFNFDKDLLLFSVFFYGLFVLLIRRAKIKFEQKNLNVILRKENVLRSTISHSEVEKGETKQTLTHCICN